MQGIKTGIFLSKKMHGLYASPYKCRYTNLKKISRPENSTRHEKGPNDQNKERCQNFDKIKAMQE